MVETKILDLTLLGVLKRSIMRTEEFLLNIVTIEGDLYAPHDV